MAQEFPAEWAEMFKGKTYDELLKLESPDGLEEDEEDRFWEAWGNAAEAAEQEQQQVRLEDEKAASEAARSTSTTEVPEEDREKPARGTPLPPLTIPAGPLDVQLQRQIALCGGIIEHLAHYVTRYDTEPYNCNNFMDRIVSMMNSSANAAKIAGRLRGSYKKDSATGPRSSGALRE